MVNLRELVESDLSDTLEGDWALPVDLIDPEGFIYENIPGQILYDTLVQDPEDGAEIIVHKPVVTIRRKTAPRVPQNNEKWIVRMPIEPEAAATKVSFTVERASEEGGSIGFVRLYCIRAKQS